MSMVGRTRVCKPNDRSASNAVDNPCDRDVLDAASAGWAYHQGDDRPSQYCDELLRPGDKLRASCLQETLL